MGTSGGPFGGRHLELIHDTGLETGAKRGGRKRGPKEGAERGGKRGFVTPRSDLTSIKETTSFFLALKHRRLGVGEYYLQYNLKYNKDSVE